MQQCQLDAPSSSLLGRLGGHQPPRSDMTQRDHRRLFPGFVLLITCPATDVQLLFEPDTVAAMFHRADSIRRLVEDMIDKAWGRVTQLTAVEAHRSGAQSERDSGGGQSALQNVHNHIAMGPDAPHLGSNSAPHLVSGGGHSHTDLQGGGSAGWASQMGIEACTMKERAASLIPAFFYDGQRSSGGGGCGTSGGGGGSRASGGGGGSRASGGGGSGGLPTTAGSKAQPQSRRASLASCLPTVDAHPAISKRSQPHPGSELDLDLAAGHAEGIQGSWHQATAVPQKKTRIHSGAAAAAELFTSSEAFGADMGSWKMRQELQTCEEIAGRVCLKAVAEPPCLDMMGAPAPLLEGIARVHQYDSREARAVDLLDMSTAQQHCHRSWDTEGFRMVIVPKEESISPRPGDLALDWDKGGTTSQGGRKHSSKPSAGDWLDTVGYHSDTDSKGWWPSVRCKEEGGHGDTLEVVPGLTETWWRSNGLDEPTIPPLKEMLLVNNDFEDELTEGVWARQDPDGNEDLDPDLNLRPPLWPQEHNPSLRQANDAPIELRKNDRGSSLPPGSAGRIHLLETPRQSFQDGALSLAMEMAVAGGEVLGACRQLKFDDTPPREGRPGCSLDTVCGDDFVSPGQGQGTTISCLEEAAPSADAMMPLRPSFAAVMDPPDQGPPSAGSPAAGGTATAQDTMTQGVVADEDEDGSRTLRIPTGTQIEPSATMEGAEENNNNNNNNNGDPYLHTLHSHACLPLQHPCSHTLQAPEPPLSSFPCNPLPPRGSMSAPPITRHSSRASSLSADDAISDRCRMDQAAGSADNRLHEHGFTALADHLHAKSPQPNIIIQSNPDMPLSASPSVPRSGAASSPVPQQAQANCPSARPHHAPLGPDHECGSNPDNGVLIVRDTLAAGSI